MGVKTGNRVNDGLVFSIDAGSRGFTKYGTGGTNNSYRNMRSMVGAGFVVNLTNTSKLENVNYYTLYGITYPEGNYSPANRDGITDGFDNISSAKRYACSRDLNYFVFDEDTNNWVADTYFNGERIDGHCYDTYDGAPAQHATFQSDFDVISSTFPNATHIVIGSHAAENNVADSNTRSRLESIGLPASHTSGTRFEYVLIGKRNKPWTWHYTRENVSAQVAHINLALPLEPQSTGILFDGTDDKISETWPAILNVDDNTTPRSWEVVIKPDVTGGTRGVFGHKISSGCSFYCNGGIFIYNNAITFNWFDNAAYQFLGNVTASAGNYYHIVGTFDTDRKPRIYVNGVLNATFGSATNLDYAGGMGIMDIGWNSKDGGQHYFDGVISVANFYKNKALNLDEVQKNYRFYQTRFNF